MVSSLGERPSDNTLNYQVVDMLFNSATFVLLHLLVFAAYWLAPKQSFRLVALFVGSMVFYGWIYWPGVIFIGLLIAVNYFLAIKIERSYSRNWLIFSVCLNLANLAYFKYIGFVAQSLVTLFHIANIDVPLPEPSYWLPLGLSFITFQKIAYLVDVYEKKVPAEKNFLVFTCFAAFYGQLIAGPIVRSQEFLPQLKSKRVFSGKHVQLGFFYFISGLMLKITVADTLAQFVDHGFSNITTLETNMAWATIYAFAIQILCDFWGYSTIALGSAYMLGIRLPINFNLPYSSTSLTEFWRRWHITLSSWLRDYLYIPLGGNRNGKTYRNLLVTMTLGGLWHGASWNFVLWGFLNGLWLSAERFFMSGRNKVVGNNFFIGLIKKLLVFHGVCLLWVLFRAQTLTDAMQYFNRLLLPPYSFNQGVPSTLVTIIICFVLFHKRLGQFLIDERFLTLTLAKQVAMTVAIILLMLAYSQARLDFIYFVF